MGTFSRRSYIAGQSRTAGIGQNNIKITAVVSDVEDCLIGGNMLHSPDDHFRAGDVFERAKPPLYNAQGGEIRSPLPDFPQQPFRAQNRQAQDQKGDGKKQKQNGTYHDGLLHVIFLKVTARQ